MKTLCTIAVLVFFTLPAICQDNPYAEFGYKPKVVYKESPSDVYRVRCSVPDSKIRYMEIDPSHLTVRLLDNRDSVISKIYITPMDLLRWTSVDPLSEKYKPYSPYAYVGNNPVNLIDPDGRIWEDPNKDQRKADQLTARLDKRDSKLEKQTQKLTEKIAKALDKGNMSKVEKFATQRNEAQNARAEITASKGALADMAGDQNKTFTFNSLSSTATVGYLSTKANGTTVINYISGSDANTIHELTHGSQVQKGLMTGIPGSTSFSFNGGFNPVQAESAAYRSQMAFDPGSLPSSRFPSPASLTGSFNNFILGIFTVQPGGRISYPYDDLIGF